MCDTPNTTGNPRLDLARLFLRSAHSTIDPALPDLLAVLQSVGAAECWHKHGTFFEHLLHVYKILKLWGVPDAVARCGLFHSSYSNSYVNLAIFKPNVDRQRVRELVGDVAEELIHMFCIVPRQELIFDLLLFNYTDEQLREGLRETDHLFDEQGNIKFGCNSLEEVAGSRTQILPKEGMIVKHIRTGEELQVSRHLIAIFLTLTMADFIDQLFSWQDNLFANTDGKLEFKGNDWRALWPGDCKPGLWMSAVSRMGVLLNIIVREERLEAATSSKSHQNGGTSLVEGIELVLPPVFNSCSIVLPPEHQIRARDMYTEALCLPMTGNSLELAEPLLLEACLANPWIAEPHLVLAQIYASTGRFEIAFKEADQGLQLLLEWGTNWDKKMTWEGWIAWARVLLQNAKEQQWPSHSWGMINLGLVK